MTIMPTILAIIGPLRTRHTYIAPGTLIDDLGLDQLDRQTIATELDEVFGIEISDATLEGWTTLEDIEATVHELAGETV